MKSISKGYAANAQGVLIAHGAESTDAAEYFLAIYLLYSVAEEGTPASALADAAMMIFSLTDEQALAGDAVEGVRGLHVDRVEKIVSTAGVRLDISTGKMVRDINSRLVMSL